MTATIAPVQRFSVAICTYNGSRYLPEQLESLVRQQRLPDEVVISDDGSTDGTCALLEDFRQRAPFPVCLCYNPKNLGYSRNFAQAVQHCSGDLVALCDQDDFWYPRKLHRLEQLFAEHPSVGGVFSNGTLRNTASEPVSGDLWSSFHFGRRDQQRVNAGDAVPVLLRRNVVTGMAFAFRRPWGDVLSVMPDHWPHDFWLALRIAAESRLLACPEMLVSYRVHGHQQIGVPITRNEKLSFVRRRGLAGYVALSRERNLREYLKDAIQFEALLDAARRDPTLAAAWWLSLAREKAEHSRRGVSALQGRRAARVALALGHWQHYRRYAPTGIAALARDLLL